MDRERALWELGLVGGGGHLPDYPASDQSHFKWVLAPYLIYRGQVFRADREGARARLHRNRLFAVEMSFAASFATRSRDNRARQGMPDLDYMLEAGPRLAIPLSELGGRGKLQLFVPLRAVFSTSGRDFRHRGFSSTPALYLRLRDVYRPGWLVIGQVTSNFGTRPLMGYFYDVSPDFVRPDRPEYRARQGYMGSDVVAGLMIPIAKKLRIFTGAQGLYHGGSANETSPLFRRRLNYSVFIGLAYMLFESKQKAYPIDLP